MSNLCIKHRHFGTNLFYLCSSEPRGLHRLARVCSWSGDGREPATTFSQPQTAYFSQIRSEPSWLARKWGQTGAWAEQEDSEVSCLPTGRPGASGSGRGAACASNHKVAECGEALSKLNLSCLSVTSPSSYPGTRGYCGLGV